MPLLGVVTLLAVVVTYLLWPQPKIDYNTQVKPILNKRCIACHGGVKKKGGFSLLFQEEALGNTESGKPAIIPGNASKSELIRRITHSNPEERMPYKQNPLSQDEIDILTRWIDQGAAWGEHWAYMPVEKGAVPDIKDHWISNDIDRFILDKLRKEAVSPSAQADKPTILRRVSLDLTGLPPDEIIAEKFLNDSTPQAFETLVNNLLGSPAFGERWAALWMDIARYADTRGYEADRGRIIWKYRDWLIRAFNSDKPYDDFLLEQLAGDLMPNPTDDLYLATAFHRNTMTNDEGGTENEEFRTAAVMDRVNTTWGALMGTTFSCVQCHSHPYDPFRHEEYYSFMAFFNNTRDEDTDSEYPLLRQYKGEDSLKLIEIKNWITTNVSQEKGSEYFSFLKTWQPTINSLQCDKFNNAALVSSWYAGLRKNGSCRLPGVTLQNKKQLMLRYTSGYQNGQCHLFLDSLNGKLLKTIPLSKTNGWVFLTVEIPTTDGVHDVYFKYENPGMVSYDDTGVLFDWFQFGQPLPGQGKPGYEKTKKLFKDLLMAKPETTPIMVENNEEQFRKTHVFERGNWLVKGESVDPAVPHIMNKFPEKAPKNRLGLAQWMVNKKNPLVARTMVNRLWEQLFGHGIAETLEDLGTQGITPTHKELLDHLAWRFMNDYEWSIKTLLKEMVMSATYRQDSKTNESLTKVDPENLLYARGPRIRLSAEQLRDQSLAVCNLLSKKMYGKSVMPYQPSGIWRSPYNGESWQMSSGEDQHRRALYTYWKRTAPYPSMITFDGAAREVCITQRIRTNTPLQALTSLNDSTSIIMARSFAVQMLKSRPGDVKQQIANGYQSMMYKPISTQRLTALVDLFNASHQTFSANPEAAKELQGKKEMPVTANEAAMVVVANALLNLDEWLTKN